MIDLTLPFREDMLIFPGHPSFEPETMERFEEDGKRLHYFSANAHQGTHVDAPSHFVEDGKNVDELDLGLFFGPARVVDLREWRGEPVDADLLESTVPDPESVDRLVLVTGDVDAGYSNEEFFDEASYVTVDGAEWLVERGVSLLANDFMTEAVPGHPDRPVHRTLLGAGIPIVEYLTNTAAIADETTVEFTCLPLRIPGFEAAPARVVAQV